MIKQVIPALDPRQKADLIYRTAQSELAGRLWRAALGDPTGQPVQEMLGSDTSRSEMAALLAALTAERPESGPQALPSPSLPAPSVVTAAPPPSPPVRPAEVSSRAAPQGLGVNARHQSAIEQAAERTGMPAPVLAAIVDAEAAKGRDGSWKLYSRNPRSSAAGLGQFLAGTWQSEAERPGTWLNRTAQANGWLTQQGRIDRGARRELLALRYDAEASINAVADYAQANLKRVRAAGVQIGESLGETARAAYLGHHLGVGDAIKFLKSGLDPARARLLLNAQVGAASASTRIESAGNAVSAHRAWLLGFVDSKIRPERFAA